MLKIGTLSLKSNLVLAPMAGISDLPFRLLNRRYGCELAFVEMLNARSASYKSRKTQQMLSTFPKDDPLGIQILGVEPKFILKALEVLEQYKYNILDLNAACPVKKVVRRGEGAGLLREPRKLNALLKLIVRESRVPVTAKIRIGWDKDSVNAKDVALAVQEAGASGLFVHGRTRAQGYSGAVDYKEISKVKKALSIPVMASGDVFSSALAKKMLDETGCDGLVIARGALGNPWIFEEVSASLRGKPLPKRPDKAEIAKVMLGHLSSCVDFYGEGVGVMIFRKFFSWYTKGFRRIRCLRERSSRVKTKEEMAGIIEECTREKGLI